MRVCLAAWLVLLLARAAHAGPAVLLVETRDSPALPGLAPQVELHASHRASVQMLDERTADPLTYAERAAQLVASGEASIVIWIARVDRGYLVFAAGGWPGRALIELVRVGEAIEPAELERTIALKIAGLLDTLLVPRISVREVLGVGSAADRPGVGSGGGRPEEDAGEAGSAARWRIEVAGLVAREPHQRRLDGRTALAVSRAWAGGGWSLAPTLAVHWQPSGAIEGDGGRASLTELGAAAAAEGGRRLGPLEVLARPRFAVAAMVAEGVSADGRRGEATVLAPYAGVEVGARWRISGSAEAGVIAGGELALIHHEFLIDQETILDLGRGRVHVGLSLTVSL